MTSILRLIETVLGNELIGNYLINEKIFLIFFSCFEI